MTTTERPLRPPQAVARRIAAAKRVLAVTHMNPDGDAIGALVAIGHIASALGIDARLYCETPFPAQFAWLNPSKPMVTSLASLGDWTPDLLLFLDCADEKRAGGEMEAFLASCRAGGILTACVDHHLANPLFADLNWVDAGMSATGVMVAIIAKELGLPLSGGLGEALYLAIVTDTGSFSYGNTNATAMELAAEIVRNGLSMAEFTAKYENIWTLDRMHLWGSLMREVRILCDGKAVVSVVTNEHLARHKARHTDLEGYASWLRRLAGVKVVLLARPARNGCKLSLRSMNEVDVQKIAAELGGGGHKGAAGVDMKEEPREAAAMALTIVCRALGCRECDLDGRPL
ncbi:MAG: DHH family phosphoesterase [Deltaproteobacteria bacterium]|jgi:phosphoesterase RecJ-like protein|nr:DHH family phosphoesterase [Deltaproteobacteria bacterium]